MPYADVEMPQSIMVRFNETLFIEKTCVGEIILLISSSELGLASQEFYITCNGKIVRKDTVLEPGSICHVVPRLIGGKGGFGSMLRAIGAQIEKTTSREACRDLSGRRMRDVNNEKQLREWVGKQADREREKEERRQARIEKRRAVPNHKFEDVTYEEQKQKVAEGLDDALAQGLSKTSEPGPSGSGLKRKAEATVTRSKQPRHTEWLGVDVADVSDLGSESDSESESSVMSTTEDTCEQPTDQSDNSKDAAENENKECGTPTSTNEKDQCTICATNEDRSNMKSQLENNDIDHPVCSNGSAFSDEKTIETTSNITDDANIPVVKTAVVSVEKSTAVENKPSEEPIDLESYNSLQDLLPLGLDSLKEELSLRGLKCGGNLEQRAERLWAVRGLEASQYPSNLLAKPGKVKNK